MLRYFQQTVIFEDTQSSNSYADDVQIAGYIDVEQLVFSNVVIFVLYVILGWKIYSLQKQLRMEYLQVLISTHQFSNVYEYGQEISEVKSEGKIERNGNDILFIEPSKYESKQRWKSQMVIAKKLFRADCSHTISMVDLKKCIMDFGYIVNDDLFDGILNELSILPNVVQSLVYAKSISTSCVSYEEEEKKHEIGDDVQKEYYLTFEEFKKFMKRYIKSFNGGLNDEDVEEIMNGSVKKIIVKKKKRKRNRNNDSSGSSVAGQLSSYKNQKIYLRTLVESDEEEILIRV